MILNDITFYTQFKRSLPESYTNSFYSKISGLPRNFVRGGGGGSTNLLWGRGKGGWGGGGGGIQQIQLRIERTGIWGR